MLLTLLLSTILGLGPLHEAGYQGQGITIAVIDGGFYHYQDTSAMAMSQVISTHDLIEPEYKPYDFSEDPNESHGTKVLSTMLYNGPDFQGTAPKARYILIRTEDAAKEYIYETDRLVKGMQLADSLGANIITISLGYNEFDDSTTNYTYADLTGELALSETATEMMHKGILVCVSAGNSGNKPWRYITPPADAKDILTVGATNDEGQLAAFSSVGPTADGRIKPEVVAPGQLTTLYNPISHQLEKGNGTSFACPEVAGMAASIWSALPHLTSMELRRFIMESSSEAESPDNERGYGTPDAWKAYQAAIQTMINPRPTHDQPTKLVGSDGRLRIVREEGTYDVLGRRIEN